MKGKKWITRFSAGTLAALMLLSQTGVSGIRALAADEDGTSDDGATSTATVPTLINGEFEDDIWGDNKGWNISLENNDSDWSAIGVTIDQLAYADDQWITHPADGSSKALHYWFGSGTDTIWVSQGITLDQGTYTFTADAMGEKSEYKLKVSDSGDGAESTATALDGWNAWKSNSLTYTVSEDQKEIWVNVAITATETGAYGYLNSVKLTSGETGASDSQSDDKSGAGDNTGSGDNTGDTEPAVKADPIPASDYADGELFIDPVYQTNGLPITDEFITGADMSSYLSIKQSGAKYYDKDGNELSDQGYFNYLYENGMNYIRLRVWNDPYDENGQGYGGGNCDLDKAITIGQWASRAGMKVLIDFHYSDFWVDPGKQTVPKVWAGMSVDEKAEALSAYTTDSLNQLLDAGVNVSMVQVGNETNNGIAGEGSSNDMVNMCKLFAAGCDAVHAVAEAHDREILAAIHFADPGSGSYPWYASCLNKHGVDYDVFASSYYPYWHGTTENLTKVLKQVADTYGKKVMVAETSYVRTLEDGDGNENTETADKGDPFNYDISEQGQADEMQAVAQAVANVGDAGIGMFYWEPAWIPVQHYDPSAEDAAQVLASNREKWETYGSGVATKVADSYLEDGCDWYGGAVVENEGWFDFDGKAVSSISTYKYLRTGSKTAKKLVSVKLSEGDGTFVLEQHQVADFQLPEAAVATYNDHTSQEFAIQWNKTESEAVKAGKLGTYAVHGSAMVDGDAQELTATVQITSDNLLLDGDFENAAKGETSPWMVTLNSGKKDNTAIKNDASNVRSGDYSFKFWEDTDIDALVEQTVELEPGTYTFGGYVEGGDAAEMTDGRQFVGLSVSYEQAAEEATDDESAAAGNARAKAKSLTGANQVYKTAEGQLNGWHDWYKTELTFTLTEKTPVTLGIQVLQGANAWGAWDDMYLYKLDAAASEDDIKSDDSKSDDSKTGDTKADDAKTDDTKTDDAKVDNSKAGDSKTGDAKVDDSKAGDTKTGDAKSADTKANAEESTTGSSTDTKLPTTSEAAVKSAKTGDLDYTWIFLIPIMFAFAGAGVWFAVTRDHE